MSETQTDPRVEVALEALIPVLPQRYRREAARAVVARLDAYDREHPSEARLRVLEEAAGCLRGERTTPADVEANTVTASTQQAHTGGAAVSDLHVGGDGPLRESADALSEHDRSNIAKTEAINASRGFPAQYLTNAETHMAFDYGWDAAWRAGLAYARKEGEERPICEEPSTVFMVEHAEALDAAHQREEQLEAENARLHEELAEATQEHEKWDAAGLCQLCGAPSHVVDENVRLRRKTDYLRDEIDHLQALCRERRMRISILEKRNSNDY